MRTSVRGAGRRTLGNASTRPEAWSNWTTAPLEARLGVAAGRSSNAPPTFPSMQPYQSRLPMAVRRLGGLDQRDPPRRRDTGAALAGKRRRLPPWPRRWKRTLPRNTQHATVRSVRQQVLCRLSGTRRLLAAAAPGAGPQRLPGLRGARVVAGSKGNFKKDYQVNRDWRRRVVEAPRETRPRQYGALPRRRRGSSLVHRAPHALHPQMCRGVWLHPWSQLRRGSM